jgi:regulator-associated protein of mTOR
MQRRNEIESVPDNSVNDVQIPASEPGINPSKSFKKSSLPKKSSLTIPYSQQFATKRRLFGRGPAKSTDNTAIPTSLSASSIQETPSQQQQPHQLQGGNCPKTQFCEWSSIHFTRYSLKVCGVQDTHSDEYQELQERYRQNSWIRRNGALERRRAETSRLDDQVLVHKNPHSPTCLRFHPYNSELIVGERSGVSIWDWEEGSRVHTLTVNQPREARITTLDLVNAHNNALLLTGSGELFEQT